MTSTSPCRMCDLTTGPSGQRDVHDRPVASSVYFEAIPSLGSLVPGWILVVPRAHRLSLSDCSAEEFDDLVVLQAELESRLSRAFGVVPLVFEHGAAMPGSLVGCGVDHAHLHLVPFESNIRRKAADLAPGLSWSRHNGGVRAIASDLSPRPYIYLRDADLTEWVIDGPSLPSQLMRRAIAGVLDPTPIWNWRDNPGTEVIAETIGRLDELERTQGGSLARSR